MYDNAPLTREEVLEIRRTVVQHRDEAERRARRPLTRSHKPRHRKKAEKAARRLHDYVHWIDDELKALNRDPIMGIGGLPTEIVTNVNHLNP